MFYQSLRNVLDEYPIHVVPSISATATVSAAIALMKERNVDAVVAMDGGHLAGLFTARDVTIRVVGAARDAGTTRIADAMSAAPPSLDINTTIDHTLGLMNERGFQHVVVSASGRVVGVLSRHELADWIIRNQQEQLDCAIGAVKRMGYSNRRG